MDNIKKLQRNTQNKVIGGVCSGLADYFETDVILFRVIFLVLAIGLGTGCIIYFLLWILMPNGTPYQAVQGGEEAKTVDTEEKKGSIIGGATLILTGLFFLVHEYIPQIRWRTIWPIGLILIGLFLIIPFSHNKKS